MLRDVPRFDPLAGPGCFAQKRQTGFYARIEKKTADGDAPPHFAPAMPLDKLIENALQRDAVQWIARMGGRRRHKDLIPWIPRRRHELLQRCFEINRDSRRDESLISHPAFRQTPRREVAGAAFGFSFFGFLISFF